MLAALGTLAAIALAVIMQSTVLSGVRLLDGTPGLLLGLVVAWALVAGIEDGLVWALLGGALTDLVSAAPFGSSAVALATAAIVAAAVANSTFTASTLLPFVAAVAATLAYYIALGVALQVAGWPVPWLSTLLAAALPSAALNALLAWPLHALLAEWARRRQFRAGLR